VVVFFERATYALYDSHENPYILYILIPTVELIGHFLKKNWKSAAETPSPPHSY
jgi:hypothetical protein